MNDMKMKALTAAALLTAILAAGPVAAQEVITNPGKCAQYYPNANCQNYGPGNPYRGPQSYQGGWRNGYAWIDIPPTGIAAITTGDSALTALLGGHRSGPEGLQHRLEPVRQ